MSCDGQAPIMPARWVGGYFYGHKQTNLSMELQKIQYDNKIVKAFIIATVISTFNTPRMEGYGHFTPRR
jgi:hypothetical protein